MPSSSRESSPSISTNVRGGVVFVACAALGLVAGMAACGGPSRPVGTPMSGSAAILPSPVKAERVPTGDEATEPSASASFAPPTPAPTPVPTVTPVPASASTSAKKPQ